MGSLSLSVDKTKKQRQKIAKLKSSIEDYNSKNPPRKKTLSFRRGFPEIVFCDKVDKPNLNNISMEVEATSQDQGNNHQNSIQPSGEINTNYCNTTNPENFQQSQDYLSQNKQQLSQQNKRISTQANNHKNYNNKNKRKRALGRPRKLTSEVEYEDEKEEESFNCQENNNSYKHNTSKLYIRKKYIQKTQLQEKNKKQVNCFLSKCS